MYCKYGFGRATSHACIDIRNGRLSREEGMRLVREHDGRVPRRYLGEFLEDMALTEQDFFRVCDIFVNKSVFVTDPSGQPVRDQDGNLTKRNYDNDDVLKEFGRRSLAAGGWKTASQEGFDRGRYADVTIVDYGMGNLRSVAKAFEGLGYKALITDRPSDIEVAQRIVLPGVGAFGDGMQELRARGIISVMTEQVIVRRVPFLGICLGMQLLAEEGLENGTHVGLGWIAGRTLRLAPSDPLLRVPHIGWNDVEFTVGSVLGQGIDRTAFYFVHGYHLVPTDGTAICGSVIYDDQIVAAVEFQNIFGTQFHPEKSQRAGLAVLRNFMQA
jgi:glutamine amidotransferase